MKKKSLILTVIISLALVFGSIPEINAGASPWTAASRCPEYSKYDVSVKKCICGEGYELTDGKCVQKKFVSTELRDNLEKLNTLLAQPSIDEKFIEAYKKLKALGKLAQVRAWSLWNPVELKPIEKYCTVLWKGPPPPDNKYESHYASTGGWIKERLIRDAEIKVGVYPKDYKLLDGKIDCFQDGGIYNYIVEYYSPSECWGTPGTGVKSFNYGIDKEFTETLLKTAQAEFDFGMKMANYWYYEKFLPALYFDKIFVLGEKEGECKLFYDFEINPEEGGDLKLHLERAKTKCKIIELCIKDESMDAEACYGQGVSEFDILNDIVQKLATTGSLK